MTQSIGSMAATYSIGFARSSIQYTDLNPSQQIKYQQHKLIGFKMRVVRGIWPIQCS